MKKTLCKSTLALAVAVASTGGYAGSLERDAPYAACAASEQVLTADELFSSSMDYVQDDLISIGETYTLSDTGCIGYSSDYTIDISYSFQTLDEEEMFMVFHPEDSDLDVGGDTVTLYNVPTLAFREHVTYRDVVLEIKEPALDSGYLGLVKTTGDVRNYIVPYGAIAMDTGELFPSLSAPHSDYG